MLIAALVLPLLLLLAAFFAGAETAFATANRLKAEVRARQESGGTGRLVRAFQRDPGALLTTTLAGGTLVLVCYAVAVHLALSAPLRRLTADWPGLPVGAWVLLIEGVLAVPVVVLLGEVLPKRLLRDPGEKAVAALAVPLRAAYWLLLPLVKPAGWVSHGLVRAFGAKTPSLRQSLQRDFEAVVRESRESGGLDLDEEETEILTNVFELRTLRVKDTMVPRTDLVAIEEGTPLDAVRARFIETGFSRLPVYRERVDQIVGVVLAHDLFHEPESVRAITRPVPFVPETKSARDLLFAFLKAGTTLAVVVDEYGGTAGIVTLEDLLEELFGDIRDEHDPEAAPLRRLGEHAWLVGGRTRLDELEEAFGIVLPEGDYDTVAGFLLDRLTTVPEEQQRVELAGFRFTVLKASAARVEAVRLDRL